MPRLVVVSRYLKSGNNKKLSNYVKYIATREGAATVKENSGTAPATENQHELISSMLKDFPDSSLGFSYAEYKSNPTQKNASRFIDETLEHNADIVANKKNYIGYLANRPGAVKFGSHGLFSQTDEPINLNKVAKEVANHKGNVWTHIVSLRRDDAQKMGYDNLTAWRELVKRQIPNIAKQSKIDMANLEWYAAFHDKESNPHVHIVVYSTNEREGFLTKQGSEKIRSGFMNDIYSDELKHLYQQQTDIRDLLKSESAELMKKLSADVSAVRSVDTETIELMLKLHGQLQSVKGKKVYGYLKKDVKQTVDDIYFRLSKNESIQKMYKLWCDMEQTKHDFYSSAKVEFPSMVDNEHFKSVKNMIIRSALDMKIDIPIYENDNSILLPDEYDEEYVDPGENSRILKDPESVYRLQEQSAVNNNSAVYRLGVLYFKGERVPADYDKAEQYFTTAVADNNYDAMYQLAKLYMTDEKYNIKKAVELFETVAAENMWASYWLGRIYLFGKEGITSSRKKAMECLTKSSVDGNVYAEKMLNNISNQNYMISNTIVSLLVNLSSFIEEDHAHSQNKMYMKVDKKLQRMIRKKEKELGIKSDGQEIKYE